MDEGAGGGILESESYLVLIRGRMPGVHEQLVYWLQQRFSLGTSSTWISSRAASTWQEGLYRAFKVAEYTDCNKKVQHAVPSAVIHKHWRERMSRYSTLTKLRQASWLHSPHRAANSSTYPASTLHNSCVLFHNGNLQNQTQKRS